MEPDVQNLSEAKEGELSLPPTPSRSDFEGLKTWPSSGRRKIFPLILGLLLVVGLIFGGIKLASKIRKPPSLTLKYWGLWEPEQVMNSVIADYQRTNPKIIIEYKKYSPRQYRETLQARLAEGVGPDIFRFHNTWLPMLKNDLAPLPSEILKKGEFETTFYPVAQKDLKMGGNYYGIPLEIDTLALFYNEKLFAAAGVVPPTTWEELKNAALKLTVKDSEGKIQTSGVALGTTGNVEHWSDILALMMLQNGVDLKNPTGKLAEDALVYYTAFSQRENKIWDEEQDNSILSFAQGKVAMIFAPSWEVFEIQMINSNLSFRVVPVPQLPGTNITWASYWVEGVAKKSKHQKEAWEFLKYLSSSPPLSKLYTEAGKVRLFGEPYSRMDLGDKLIDDPHSGAFIKQAPTATSWYLSSRTFDNGINDKMIKYFEDAVNGLRKGISPKTALEQTAKGVNQVLTTYKVETP